VKRIVYRLVLIIGLLSLAFFALLSNSLARDGVVMAIGVSPDGHYAVTSHLDNQLRLWDLRIKEQSTLSRNANIYSASFVSDSGVFIWQDTDDLVHVQRVDGEVLKQFKHAPTYGHVMSPDLKWYASADIDWAIHVRNGSDVALLKAGDDRDFIGAGKVLNLSLTDTYLVSSGFSSYTSNPPSLEDDAKNHYQLTRDTVLWSLVNLEPIAKLPGNSAKTHATLSPDGQWVVSGDEGGRVLVWSTSDATEPFLTAASLFHGLPVDRTAEVWEWDRSQLIEAPDEARAGTVALKFIHHSRYYLRFGYNSHYAALFEVDNPWPLKYFDLGQRPFPATDQFSRNLAIDTAPEAGILVMGQRDGAGILVYQFDPEALTLERVWVGN